MNFANVNNIKICYEIQGDGYPLILVHGFGSKKETWIAQVCPLSEHFKVIAFDNRGAGKSERPDGPYTMEIYADDISSLMDFLRIEKAHIMGCSLGGMIVQTFVLNYPKRVNKVVLINTTYKVVGGKDDTKFSEMYVKMRLENLELQKQDPLEAFWQTARVSYYRKFRKEMVIEPKKKFYGLWSVEDIIKQHTIDPPTPRDIVNQANALEGFNTLERLNSIKNKVLLLTASHDRIMPKIASIEMLKRIPNSELKIIDNAGHGSPKSRAPEINRIVIDFLKH
ncbi:MAG: alpha/beta fold hydrolase [Promethearchaeota archaeon]